MLNAEVCAVYDFALYLQVFTLKPTFINKKGGKEVL